MQKGVSVDPPMQLAFVRARISHVKCARFSDVSSLHPLRIQLHPFNRHDAYGRRRAESETPMTGAIWRHTWSPSWRKVSDWQMCAQERIVVQYVSYVIRFLCFWPRFIASAVICVGLRRSPLGAGSSTAPAPSSHAISAREASKSSFSES
jgi:hypothetical protein